MPWPTKAVAGTKRVQAYVHYPMRIVKVGSLISALFRIRNVHFINIVCGARSTGVNCLYCLYRTRA